MKLGKRKRRRPSARRVAIGVLASVLFEGWALRMRSGRVCGNVVVRCSRGHLFTTLWIPAASVKAIRLGFWRVQRCPVGHHWALVSPVRESSLSEDQQRAAAAVHDVRLP